MWCSVRYDGNAIKVVCEDGRSVTIDSTNRPLTLPANIYRHLQDTIVLLESVITHGQQGDKHD